MANKKFSEFVLKTSTSDVSHIVGYNGAENVQITPANFLDTTGGPYLPIAGGTLTGALTINDASGSGNQLTIQAAAPSIEFIDDQATSRRAQISADNGNLILNLDFNQAEPNTQMQFNMDGSNAFSIATNKNATFAGDVTLNGGDLNVGNSGTVNSVMNMLGTNDSFIEKDTGNDLYLVNNNNDKRLRFRVRNSVGTNIIALNLGSSGAATFASTVIATADSNAKGISILGRTSDDISELNFYENDGTTLLSRLQTRTSYFFIGSITSIPMLFGIGGVEKMRLDASGNLGIGTSSPSTSLDILSTSSSPIRIIRNVNDSNVAINYTDTAGTNWYAGKSGLNHFSIGIAPNLSTNTFFNLTTTGNLGIGTSSPDALLHISQTSSNAQLIVERTGTATGKYQIYTNTNNLYFNNLASSSNPLTILDNNRIGMGNTTPDANLEISGDGASYPKLKLSNPSQTGRYLQIGMIDAVEHTIEANGGGTFLTFKTDATEKMRLTSVGELLKGTTAAVGQGTLADLNSTEIGNGYINLCRDDTANIKQIRFGKNGGEVGSISTGASATAYNTNSDYRLKEDLQDFEGLEMVSKIPVYDYKWKADESRSYGVMAHQLQEVLPQAVSGDKDAEEMQSVDYSKIVPLLVKSIQELKAEIELLKNK